MAGVRIALFRRRSLDFAALKRGGSLQYALVRHLDTARHRQGVIALRVYSSSFGSTSTISIKTIGIARTGDDPTLGFVTGTTLSQIDLDDGLTENLLTDAFDLDTTGAIAILVEASRGNGASTSNAELGAEVILRE